MNISKGDTGILTFGNNSTSKVKCIEVDNYSSLPKDYWFEYEEDENNRPLVHPEFGKSDLIKSSILLPEFIASVSFKKTN